MTRDSVTPMKGHRQGRTPFRRQEGLGLGPISSTVEFEANLRANIVAFSSGLEALYRLYETKWKKKMNEQNF